MIFIAITSPVPPRKLAALEVRKKAVFGLADNDQVRQYIEKHHTWGLLKKWLAGFSNDKCWYCEALTERATGAVEHFRPKGKVTCYRSSLMGHPGYYWLAYDWTNFRYSCQRCNSHEKDENDVLRGKQNEFALCDEGQRLRTPKCVLLEEPLLLDPCVKDDTKLLAHLVSGEVEPSAPMGTRAHERGIYTRDILGLNSFGVPKKKLRTWQDLSLLIELAGDNENDAVKARLQARLGNDAEYSSFFRAAIGTYRYRNWIASIL